MKKFNVSDHEILHFIGSGSYGQVWLARNVLGAYRAAKVVWRESLPERRQYLSATLEDELDLDRSLAESWNVVQSPNHNFEFLAAHFLS